MAKALEELPVESPASSQRSTPEPGSIIVTSNGDADVVVDPAARKAARERALEAATRAVSELGQKCSGGESVVEDSATPIRIPVDFVPKMLSIALSSSAECPAPRSVAAVVVATLLGVQSNNAEAAVSTNSSNGSTQSVVVVGFDALLSQMSSLETTVPKIKSVAANVAALVFIDRLLKIIGLLTVNYLLFLQNFLSGAIFASSLSVQC